MGLSRVLSGQRWTLDTTLAQMVPLPLSGMSPPPHLGRPTPDPAPGGAVPWLQLRQHRVCPPCFGLQAGKKELGRPVKKPFPSQASTTWDQENKKGSLRCCAVQSLLHPGLPLATEPRSPLAAPGPAPRRKRSVCVAREGREGTERGCLLS